MKPLLPGSTIGVLGSGQLGRMLALAARRMGYRTVVLSPQSDTPAGAAADREIRAEYDDEEALDRFGRLVDVVTVEFENIPAAALERLERLVPVRPGPAVLYHSQNRAREKAFLAARGIPHAPSRLVGGPAELEGALAEIGSPAVLKSAGFGYDGKGQLLLDRGSDLEEAAALLAEGPGVLERHVDFRREISVLVARSPSGAVVTYGPVENRHVRHVLDLSSMPAGSSRRTVADGLELARLLAGELELEGIMCVEFFETADGGLLVNEIAPRPHNSGHLSIEACPVSQFEQQLRAVCGLPLGETEPLSPAAMANLLGDLWQAGEPDWRALLGRPGVALHLYGKSEPRRGRKMGHLTALASSAATAAAAVLSARSSLAADSGG